MKYTRLFLNLVLTAFLLGGCQGEEGALGPQGPQGELGQDGDPGTDGVGFEKRGSVEGTVSGNRLDGTAFSESFTYEFAPNANVEGFTVSEESNLLTYDITRSLDAFYEDQAMFNVELQVLNKGTVNESLATFTNGEGFFSFYKELTSSSLFFMEAQAWFKTFEFTHIVSSANNVTYKFALNKYGEYAVTQNSDDFIMQTTDGKFVYYEPHWNNFDPETGIGYGNLIKVLDADGNIMANSPYDQLRWTFDNTRDDAYFTNLSGTDLSAIQIVPADVCTITNYVKNADTGIITFDFTMTIGTLRRLNTTRHPITITGSFNSGKKVYSDVVYRKAK